MLAAATLLVVSRGIIILAKRKLWFLGFGKRNALLWKETMHGVPVYGKYTGGMLLSWLWNLCSIFFKIKEISVIIFTTLKEVLNCEMPVKRSRDMTIPTKWVCAQWRLRSAGHRPSLISLRCAHMPFCWFCHEAVLNWRMPRLIWVFAGRTCQFVGFVMRRY